MSRLFAVAMIALVIGGLACVTQGADVEERRAALTVTAAPLPRVGWKATASVTSGSDTSAHALDGDLTTRWTTGVPQAIGQWFQLDMGTPQTFTQVLLDSATSASDYPRGFQIFVSQDALEWGLPVATSTGTGPLVAASFEAQTARYVRVVLTATASNWWSIAEINIGGRAPALPRSTWVASASLTCQADVPAHVLDGNATTRWSTGVPQAKGQWFQVDMKSPRVFGAVVMDSGTSTGDYARKYTISTSTDGVTFGNPIASDSGSGQLVAVTFPARIARYVRITLAGSASNWWSIHELNVYGPASLTDCASAVTPSATLTGAAREVQYQQDILTYCTGGGIAACEQTIRARMHVDFFMAAAQLLSNRMSTGTHIAVLRDREAKLLAFRKNPASACDVVAHDQDGDYVPDTADACPDTPPLTPVLANGCTNTQVPPGPDIAKVQQNLKQLGISADPRCAGAFPPHLPAPLGAFRLNSDPTVGKAIWVSREPDDSGCPIFYQIEFYITDGSSLRTAVFRASEDVTLPWITRPSGAVQFNIHTSDAGDRGAWASYGVFTKSFRVRAFNLAGQRSAWSDYLSIGREDCVVGQPCADL